MKPCAHRQPPQVGNALPKQSSWFDSAISQLAQDGLGYAQAQGYKVHPWRSFIASCIQRTPNTRIYFLAETCTL